MQFLKVAAGSLAVFAAGIAVALALALAYQWAHARWVLPMKRVPVEIRLPDLMLSETRGEV